MNTIFLIVIKIFYYYINCHDFERKKNTLLKKHVKNILIFKNSIIMDNDITIFLIDENC